jgi:hypothetical protein
MLRDFAAVVEKVDTWAAPAIEERVVAWLAERGLQIKDVAQAARVALTGRTASPGLYDVIAILGKDRAVARLTSPASPPTSREGRSSGSARARRASSPRRRRSSPRARAARARPTSSAASAGSTRASERLARAGVHLLEEVAPLSSPGCSVLKEAIVEAHLGRRPRARRRPSGSCPSLAAVLRVAAARLGSHVQRSSITSPSASFTTRSHLMMHAYGGAPLCRARGGTTSSAAPRRSPRARCRARASA